MAQTVKHLPAMWKTQVQSLGREDPLEKEMATHSITLDWKIPWTEDPGRLQAMRLQRVRYDWATSLLLFSLYNYRVEVRNRLKALYLIDRPGELWTEVCDTVQETEINAIPKKKKYKKPKWLSEEALQTAVKRREVKSKGEKERYMHLNAGSKE